MNMDEWGHVDLWQQRGPHFLVEVKHATYDHFRCWWVYVYVYPGHKCFARLSEAVDASQISAAVMPLHGGPTLLRRSCDYRGAITCVQVGADYHHLDAAAVAAVFLDAEKLFAFLESPPEETPRPTGDPSHD